MSEQEPQPKRLMKLNGTRSLAGATQPSPHPAVADILEGLAVQNAVPPELMPALAEMLTYIYQMDDVAEKRKQIQRR